MGRSVCGFAVAGETKSSTGTRPFCHWIEKGLHRLPPDERKLIEDIIGDPRCGWDTRYDERLTQAAILISEVRIIGEAP